MSKIVHVCSSVLVRPNGIVRYINTVIDLQRKLGHEVIFVCDSKPSQTINADKCFYDSEISKYVPNMKDGHVWLQVDPQLSKQIENVFLKNTINADLIIAHDIHSYLGASSLFLDGIFIQHESDVWTSGARYSFLSDEYLEQQRSIINNSSWRIGVSFDSKTISPNRAVYTPIPFNRVSIPNIPKSKGLLYMGDSTERKGAKEFMEVARQLGVTPTVITHERDSKLFEGAEVYSFKLDQRKEMYELMAQHRAAFISSKNEYFPIVVLECLQFMPVVVDSQYAWTQNLEDLNVIRVTGNELVSTIKSLLENPINSNYSNSFDNWINNSRRLWINLTT